MQLCAGLPELSRAVMDAAGTLVSDAQVVHLSSEWHAAVAAVCAGVDAPLIEQSPWRTIASCTSALCVSAVTAGDSGCVVAVLRWLLEAFSTGIVFLSVCWLVCLFVLLLHSTCSVGYSSTLLLQYS